MLCRSFPPETGGHSRLALPRDREIADGLRKAYDWRSHVVHGGDDPTPKDLKRMGKLDDAVSLCEQTLRRALSKWLSAPPAADLHEIDDRFLD